MVGKRRNAQKRSKTQDCKLSISKWQYESRDYKRTLHESNISRSWSAMRNPRHLKPLNFVLSHTFRLEQSDTTCVLSPDGTVLAIVTPHALRIMSTQTGSVLQEISRPQSLSMGRNSVVYSPDGLELCGVTQNEIKVARIPRRLTMRNVNNSSRFAGIQAV